MAAIDPDIIEGLRQAYPALMRIPVYMAATGRSEPSVYRDMKRLKGLAVKSGRTTLIVRDVWLNSLEYKQEPAE